MSFWTRFYQILMIFKTNLFDRWNPNTYYQLWLPIMIWLDLGVMTTKAYPTLPIAPLRTPDHQMQFGVIFYTPVSWRVLTSLNGIQSVHFQPSWQSTQGFGCSMYHHVGLSLTLLNSTALTFHQTFPFKFLKRHNLNDSNERLTFISVFTRILLNPAILCIICSTWRQD